MSEKQNFFNMGDESQGILRDLAPGLTARVFAGEQVMLSMVNAEPNATGTIHSHPEEQWGVMLEGSGTRIQEGQEFPVEVGDFWRTPGGVAHGFQAGSGGARILDIFSPPRDEYRCQGSGFGQSNPSQETDGSPLPTGVREV